MLLERFTPWVGAVGAPVLGLLLRSSRRNRLLQRVRTYTELADELDSRDPESAALLREVVTQTVRRIVQTEQAALARRLDPGAIVMAVLITSPGFVGLVLAWHHHDWWRWPVLFISALWVILMTATGWQTAWQAHEDQEEQARLPEVRVP